MALVEREWTDKFGHHWEAQVTESNGAIRSIKLTKTATGWPDKDVARALLTSPPTSTDVAR